MQISIRSCEKAIGINALDWPCQCHAIANLVLEHHPKVKGFSRYGKYLGPIAEGSPFHGKKIARHGWIERPRGGIIDPTRWVFENVDPYIFVCGANDSAVADYDVAGDRFKARVFGGTPPPPPHCGIACPVDWPQSVKRWLRELFGTDQPCRDQTFWLANRSLVFLGKYAKAVYQALIEAGKSGWIPIDNRQVIFDDRY